MTKKRKQSTSEKLSQIVVRGIQEKKGVDIVILDLRKIKNTIADFFVICSGNNDKQLEAIAQSIDEQVYKTMKESPWHWEGKNNKEWVLLDYSDVVVHIFKKEKRNFYNLEQLWGDAEIIHIKENI